MSNKEFIKELWSKDNIYYIFKQYFRQIDVTSFVCTYFFDLQLQKSRAKNKKKDYSRIDYFFSIKLFQLY